MIAGQQFSSYRFMSASGLVFQRNLDLILTSQLVINKTKYASIVTRKREKEATNRSIVAWAISFPIFFLTGAADESISG